METITTNAVADRIERWADRAQARNKAVRQRFFERAAASMTDAIRWVGAEAMEAEALVRIALYLREIAHQVSEDEALLEALKVQLAAYERRMLEFHSWAPNSTCPLSNVENVTEAKATCTAIRFLRDLLEE